MKHLLVILILIAVSLSFVLGFIISAPSGFNSVETQVDNQRKADSLRSVIELNKKLLKIYENHGR